MSDDYRIENFDEIRAQQVVDLLRLGMDVAVIGRSGIGKTVAMHRAEKMLPEYELTDRVWFFYEWSGSPLPKKQSPDHLFVVESNRFADVPPGFAVVPVISLRGQTPAHIKKPTP